MTLTNTDHETREPDTWKLIWFQVRTKDDKLKAWRRVSPMGGNDPFKIVYHLLLKRGIPNVLFIGTFHVEHLKTFAQSKYTPMKYSKLLSCSRFMGVSGTKWWCIKEHLNCEDLPEKKRGTW